LEFGRLTASCLFFSIELSLLSESEISEKECVNFILKEQCHGIHAVLVAFGISAERNSLLSPLKKLVFLIVSFNEQKVFHFVAKITLVLFSHQVKETWKSDDRELLEPGEQVTPVKLGLFRFALRLPLELKRLPLHLEELELIAAPGFPLPKVLRVFFVDLFVWEEFDDPRRRRSHLLFELLGRGRDLHQNLFRVFFDLMCESRALEV